MINRGKNNFKTSVHKSFNKKSNSTESTGVLVSARILQLAIGLPVEAVRKASTDRLQM